MIANALSDLRCLIADDGYAASFKTFSQYRTALLDVAATLLKHETSAVLSAMESLDAMTAEDRLKVLSRYCHSCGCLRQDGTQCQCPLIDSD